MNRRDALIHVGLITGLAFLGSSSLLSSCSGVQAKEFLEEDDVTLLNEIGEVIIPATTGSPGAKAANTGQFIQIVVQDCLLKEEQKKFMQGWQFMQVLGKEKYQEKMEKLSDKEKMAYLSTLNTAASISTDNEKSDLAISAFQKIKNLTIKGYFTSEIGATQALRYDPVPGKFSGTINYKPGDKGWALSM